MNEYLKSLLSIEERAKSSTLMLTFIIFMGFCTYMMIKNGDIPGNASVVISSLVAAIAGLNIFGNKQVANYNSQQQVTTQQQYNNNYNKELVNNTVGQTTVANNIIKSNDSDGSI